jgi:orotate phosphoribosyltransferase
MNYRNMSNLVAQSKKLANLLPRDVELIVGIPRSGLLVANLIALYRNLPFTDVQSFIDGKLLYAGKRLKRLDFEKFLQSPRKVVVVDDSLRSGNQMKLNKQRIKELTAIHNILYVVVFIEPGMENTIDFYSEVVKSPRCFEWNIMHHSILRNTCVDIDGVLCRDPTREENDGGPLYEEFLINVEPNIIPSTEIGWLVTCRLEKYRKVTEMWLKRQGVQYQSLVMMNYPNKEARVSAGNHAEFKANWYRNVNANLFIESSSIQAKKIAQLTNKPVFCVENWEMITRKNALYSIKRRLYSKKNVIRKKIKEFFGE